MMKNKKIQKEFDCGDFILVQVDSHNLKILLNEMYKNKDYLAKELPWAKDFSVKEELDKDIGIWNNETKFNLCIFDTDKKICLGKIGVEICDHGINAGDFSINYWVFEKFEGRGIATKAVKVISQYLFEEFNAERMIITVLQNNIKSMRVACKAGFVLESKENHFDVIEGKNIKAFHFVKLSDFKAQKELKQNEKVLKKLYGVR